MYADERSLVDDLHDEPFTYLGVNSDSLERIRRVRDRENLTYRMWWDESTRGPIATRWDITGWPTTFVLDADGVVRFQGLRGAELRRAVEALLAEEASSAGVDLSEPSDPSTPVDQSQLEGRAPLS